MARMNDHAQTVPGDLDPSFCHLLPFGEGERRSFACGSADERPRDTAGNKKFGLLLDDREIQRTVGLKWREGSGNKAVDFLGFHNCQTCAGGTDLARKKKSRRPMMRIAAEEIWKTAPRLMPASFIAPPA